ncbi:MAG: hypothetical protein IPJ78_11155 [Gemmatimonadetes bacterium]|nr:hypothetical protein [Gemmatimonadota bacterium]
MPIRRPRTPHPALRHVSLLETMATVAPEDPRFRAAQAAFLTLRLFDHWVAFGSVMTSESSRTLATTRDDIARLEVDAELRGILAAITETLVALPAAEPHPLLPRLHGLAVLLESRGHQAEAGDVYATIARHADPVTQLDLAFESQMRAGRCLRRAGELGWADQCYAQAAALAARDRDRLRQLLARLGRAKVLWDRGDHAAADAMIDELIADAEDAQSAVVTSMLLYERAQLSWARGDRGAAARQAFRAFDLAPGVIERDEILVSLAGWLEVMGAIDAARVTRGALEAIRLAGTRPSPRRAESDRATAIEVARAIADALRGAGLAPEPSP